MQDANVQRLAGHQSGECETADGARRWLTMVSRAECFARYFPKCFSHHRKVMRKLQAQHGFRPPFKNSVYPAACANCGPKTTCRAHRDGLNYPTTPCAITALGDYDPELGGHLVLFELGIYIDFPPGATILLSSACFLHGNVPIRPGERRFSFTQFSAGALMQWTAYGFKLAGDPSLTAKKKVAMEQEAGEGFAAQLGRLSKLWELEEDRAALRAEEAEFARGARR